MIEVGSIVRSIFGERRVLGRVIDMRDYGFEVWIESIDPDMPRQFYTHADQIEEVSLLDLVADPPSEGPV